MMRMSERAPDQLRPVKIEADYIKHAEGSVLISVGDTRVVCTATVEEKVPPFMRNQGKGWVTAEYAMIPRATAQRNFRESMRGKVGGRTMEIQRMIGRALRAVVDLDRLGERTIWLDCDVIQADGGTRTASLTNAYIAIIFALQHCLKEERLKAFPLTDFLAATSVGITKQGEVLLDLCYEEDADAHVDMNIVMTGKGEFVEIQGSGEEHTFSKKQLQELLDYADKGIQQLISIQKEVLGDLAMQIERQINPAATQALTSTPDTQVSANSSGAPVQDTE